MERLEAQYKLLKQALKRLKYIIDRFKIVCANTSCKTKEQDEEDEYIIYRDSLIKRFEFCYDLNWKFLKKYLEEKYGVLVASPRKVFHACLEQKITTTSETEKLLEIIDIRNNTSHIYSEELADQAAKLIIDHYQILADIISRIKT